MKSKMQAAVVEKFGMPLVLREWDIPSPGPGQIVVKVEACGVCHTDLHAARGDWPVKPTLPFIPGHEGGLSNVAARGHDARIARPKEEANQWDPDERADEAAGSDRV